MILIYLLVFILSVLYLLTKYVYSHWERKGFPYIKPSIPFGNLVESFYGRKSIGVELYDLHKTSKKPVEGVYFLFRPALMFRDASLIKQILTADFGSFYDRGFYHNPNDAVAANMFMKSGQDWKSLRSKLTPTFTSGKLKGMMPTIIQIAENLKHQIVLAAASNEIVEMKDLCVRFAMDVIGTVGFGLDVNSLEEPNHSFREIEKHVTSGALMNRIRLIGSFFCPKLLELLHVSALPAKYQKYMVDIVRATMEHRDRSDVKRKDFIQLLLELRKTGKISDDTDGVDADDTVSSETKASQSSLTIEQCAAQVSLFYLAGFDTTSSTISYTLFELSRKPDLQKRLHDEIDEVMAKHNNAITHESINDMPFLELCVRESVRKYPTLPFLNRFCTKEYPIPNLGLTIPEGTPIVISLLGLMRDPDNFPDPDNYLPDRFSEDKPMYNPDAFIPFGDGPRSCIGLRMGKMVTKIALVSLLQNYSFECVNDEELVIANHALTIAIDGGIELRVTKRK